MSPLFLHKNDSPTRWEGRTRVRTNYFSDSITILHINFPNVATITHSFSPHHLTEK